MDRDILRLSAGWGLLGAVIVAIFWGVWSIFDDVPLITRILLLDATTKDGERIIDYATLPFEISRWWDILGALWGGCLLSMFFCYARKELESPSNESKDLEVVLVVVLVLALLVGLGSGLSLAIGMGIICGLLLSLFFGILRLIFVGLTLGLVAGLGFGIFVGLPIGLLIGLLFVLSFFTSLFFTNALIQVWKWGKAGLCGAYKGIMEKPKKQEVAE